MTRRICAVLILLLIPVGMAVSQEKLQPKPNEWYIETYPFIQQRGRIFTAETEFDWPEGYREPDSATLTPFQYWVSHIPLWHSERPAARIKGVMYSKDEICRSVHVPWRTIHFYDYFIPVQLMAEYYFAKGDTASFAWAPDDGDTITYDRFLNNTHTLYLGRELQFKEAEPREPSDKELNRMMDLISRHTTYGSLVVNSSAVSRDEIAPGDMLIAKNENGRKGLVWIILNVLRNDDGERLFLVGTGCQEVACDFHIPRFNADRSDPWITLDTLLTLAGKYTDYGFYRLPVD